MIINKKYFAEYSPCPINFDQTEIRLYIDVAEKIWIIPVIGQELYDEIQDQIDNNQLSEENGTLLTDGGLWQYLCFATCLEGLPFLWADISQAGITVGESEFSHSITLKDLNYIEQHLRRQTEVLKQFVYEYLCERQNSFPLFDPKNCNCGCGCGTTIGSCCGEDTTGKLYAPNKLKLAYSTFRKNTDIR